MPIKTPCNKCGSINFLSYNEDGELWRQCVGHPGNDQPGRSCSVAWFARDDAEHFVEGPTVALERPGLNRAEPAPVANASVPIWELVIADMQQGIEPVWDLVIPVMRQRDQAGRAKYGQPLQAHNGRNAHIDALQEALDLAAYLRQIIEERGEHVGLVPRDSGDILANTYHGVLDVIIILRELIEEREAMK